MPEKGTAEFNTIIARVDNRIMNTASNIAVRRKNLPSTVHIVVHDDLTGEKFGSYARVEYVGNEGMAQITRTSIGMIRPGSSIIDIADGLLERRPGVPLLCDRKTADELAEESLTWISEDHYQLQGRPFGILEVYIPYQAEEISLGTQPGAGIQIYKE